jgi:uncharacterized membrane protein YoaK (UPF0700 family)
MSAEAPQPTLSQQPAPLAPRPFGILMLAGYQLLVGIFGLCISGLFVFLSVAADGAKDFAVIALTLGVFAIAAIVTALAIGLLRRWRWAHRATIALFILELLAAAAVLIVSQGQQVGFFGLALNVFFVYYLVTPKVYAYFGTA